jgi:hypothetical protein
MIDRTRLTEALWWCKVHRYPANPKRPMTKCQFAALVESATSCDLVLAALVFA